MRPLLRGNGLTRQAWNHKQARLKLYTQASAVMPTAKTIPQLLAELASYLTTHGLDGPWAVLRRYALTARRGVTQIHIKYVADSNDFLLPDRAVVIGRRGPLSPDAREWQHTRDAACLEVAALAEFSSADEDDDLLGLAVNVPVP